MCKTQKTERKAFSKEEKQNILNKTNCLCGHCGKQLTLDTMTIEHIFPLHKGGNHDEFNLVALCEECNNEKSNLVYEITDYYTYIDIEYLPQYMRKLTDLKLQNKQSSRLLDVDIKAYDLIPIQYKMTAYNMIKRGTKRKKVMDFLDRVTIKLKLEKAYEADAEEIYNLIEQLRKKSDDDILLYDSEYDVLNAIKVDEVYVLRSKDKIQGAFIFKRIQQDKNRIELLQLNTIEENSCLKQKYITTLAIVAPYAVDLYNDIMCTFSYSLIKECAIPMFFNKDGKRFNREAQSYVVEIPYTLEGNDGILSFMTLRGLKNQLKSNWVDYIKKGMLTDEDVDDWIEETFDSREDLTDIETEFERQDLNRKLIEKIKENTLKQKQLKKETKRNGR